MCEILTLSALPIGQSAYVTHIHAQPDMELHLTDLGLIPGTKVVCVAESPAGDPKAYLIRGTLIALRNSDGNGIHLQQGAESS